MLVVPHPRGHVAVTQGDHASMCAQLARAWGNERFGPVSPAAEVQLAADQHELGWTDWDASPTLNPSTGLPFTVIDLDLPEYVNFQLEGPRKLAARSPYAAVLALYHHMSFYSRPTAAGPRSSRDRLVSAHLRRSSELAAELRAGLDASDAEIDRNWRLVRTWDALSHDILMGWGPSARGGVPAAGGDPVELRLDRDDAALTLDPWPFADASVRVHAEGSLLEQRFSDQGRMRAALADAPRMTLDYELAPI